jgi:hypothetical protein
MPYPQLVLKNQFGEESINAVLDSEGLVPAATVVTGSIIANLSGSTDFPEATPIATVAAALPSANMTAKVLTGLGAGSDTAILATDTILEAMAKLQAQITALQP